MEQCISAATTVVAAADDKQAITLCASCDRCRSRKTKCDGKRPCSNCIAKYLKTNRVESVEGIDVECFDCVYSPAKRRGPSAARRTGTKLTPSQHGSKMNDDAPNNDNIPTSIQRHQHFLDPSDIDGNALRAKFQLAVNSLLRLGEPPGTTNTSTAEPSIMAVRFAVVAVGALIGNNDIYLAMELCNAAVHCLQEAVRDDGAVPRELLLEVAKAYFYLGVFRAMRGDMVRYFRYRRVVLGYVSRLPNEDKTYRLLGAISYLDAWAYMIYNANEEELPVANSPFADAQDSEQLMEDVAVCSAIESKFNIKTDVFSIASNPTNINWIQGAPPVFLNNDAPVSCRILDAVACVFRTCCDRANDKFCDLVPSPQPWERSATASAVLAHENELCSRNVLLSTYALLEQSPNDGQRMVVSSLDAFFEKQEGFTEHQIQSLLSVGNFCLENPLMLFHPGPTYHMVSNAAILLAHAHNSLESGASENRSYETTEESTTVQDEVLETYIAIRKVLTLHRNKLPSQLQCHSLPRVGLRGEGSATIDLGETLLCGCRSCQGFVLAACSPCVAAERAAAAAARQREMMAAQEDDMEQFFGDVDDEFGQELVNDEVLMEILDGQDFGV